jgi:hypothetical protein
VVLPGDSFIRVPHRKIGINVALKPAQQLDGSSRDPPPHAVLRYADPSLPPRRGALPLSGCATLGVH